MQKYTNQAPLADALAAQQANPQGFATYIDRICDRIDQVEPHVEAFVPENNRRQRMQQVAAELQSRNATHTLPLYGAILGVKDIFYVDGFDTKAGSDVPTDHFNQAEAVSVSKLRDAGALVAGKTVTTEFAYFAPGPTRNPHNTAHTPGGSSSGSAASVAAGMCTLALGTQTVGSVIRPAAFCGIVGFKPSYGRLNSTGILYYSRTVDHVGLFTQDVQGMTQAACIVCDNWTEPLMATGYPILGVPEGPYLQQASAEALKRFERQVADLQEKGFPVKRVPVLDNIESMTHTHNRLIYAELAEEHAPIYDQYQHLYRQRTRDAIDEGRTVSADEVAVGRASCLDNRASIEALMDREGIDLWVCPSAPGPAPQGIHATGNPCMNMPWTHTGMPAITLPADYADNGLPLGLQCVTHFGRDEALLLWATMLSDALQPRLEREQRYKVYMPAVFAE
ncbi:MAG: amidase [Chloroflexota bacterium]